MQQCHSHPEKTKLNCGCMLFDTFMTLENNTKYYTAPLSILFDGGHHYNN